MPRRSRSRAEDRLVRVEEKLAARRARCLTYAERMTGVPYHQRTHNERWALLGRRLLEAARMEAEGNTPPEQLEKLRWSAHESFRRGVPVCADEYDAAHAPAAVPVAAAEKELIQEAREWKPKLKERDVLADYSGRTESRLPAAGA